MRSTSASVEGGKEKRRQAKGGVEGTSNQHDWTTNGNAG